MRILHIDETFHPAFGYQCNPLAKFQQLEGNEVIILTVEAKYIYPVYYSFGEYGENIEQQDKTYEESTDVKIVRIPARGYIARRLVYKSKSLYEAINKINPDVILVHCLETLTAMRVLIRFKNKYPLVFDSHMLSMASQNKFASLYEKVFQNFITPMIKKNKLEVIITQKDDYVNKHLGIPKEQTHFISFGTDTRIFYPSEEMKNKFLDEYNLSKDTFIVVSTGKLSKTKDGMLLANVAMKKFNLNRNVVFVIVANFEGEYEKNVKCTLDRSENKIIYFPVQNYLRLPQFYQIADVCVFPNQCSMSFYDAQACGAPVISENNNININRNSHGNGFCFEAGNVESFRKQIEKMASMDRRDYLKMRENSLNYIKENYSYSKIASQYTQILKREYDRFNKEKK